MFIENPNKKETYSFRVKPDLLENIKNYAKATNQTVPEILNDLIEEKVDGLHLTNDYLNNTMNSTNIIGLPPLEDIYNNGKYKEFGLFFENNNRVLYEFQKLPNNLDTWTDKEGYTSTQRGVDHEGISFVLAPELITKPEYLETPEILLCCLVPVYFRISLKKKSVQVKNISFDEALRKIRASPNMELLDEFTKNTELVKDIIQSYSNRFKNASVNPDGTYYVGGFIYSDKNQLLLDLFNKLLIELNEASIIVNVNVLSHKSKAIERTTTKEELLNTTLVDSDPVRLWNEIDELKDELRKSTKENEDLKKENEDINQKLTDLQQQVTQMAKVWAEISKEENTTKTNESKQ